jgi:hypothetical protein
MDAKRICGEQNIKISNKRGSNRAGIRVKKERKVKLYKGRVTSVFKSIDTLFIIDVFIHFDFLKNIALKYYLNYGVFQIYSQGSHLT